jgi:hypothetical protein
VAAPAAPDGGLMVEFVVNIIVDSMFVVLGVNTSVDSFNQNVHDPDRAVAEDGRIPGETCESP